MTVPVKAVPLFMENRENEGIVTGDKIDMPIVMPNESKVFLRNQKTSLSQSSVNFQVPNVSSFINSNLELEFTFQIVSTGKTIVPDLDGVGAGAALAGTPPYFWSAVNGGVDPLIINKMINYISFNIANKQFTESNGRNEVELMDLYGLQLDQQKLKEHGIYLQENAGVPYLTNVYGQGVVPMVNLNAGSTNANLQTVSRRGYQLAQVSPNSMINNTHLKAYKQDYVQIKSVEFSTTEALGGNVKLVATQIPEYGPGVFVPVYDSGANEGEVYFSTTANTLTQTTTIVVREYLISPNTSNPYSHNPYAKSYPTLGYPFNLQLNFNTDYMKYGVVALSANGSGQNKVTTQVTLVDAGLNLYTFDTEKKFESDTLRTLYTYVDKQTVPTKSFLASDNSEKSQTVASSNLTSLPPYIFMYVSTRMWENPSILNAVKCGGVAGADSVAPNELLPYVLNPLTRVKIEYGSQADVVWGTDASIKELQDLTMECLKDKSLRKIVANQLRVPTSSSLFNTTTPPALFPTDFDQYFVKENINASGLPFLLIKTGSLNFRPLPNLSNLPVIPEFNYGSQNYRSLRISMSWTASPALISMIPSASRATTSITYNPSIVFVTKRVRSISLSGQGVMADDIVEYDLQNNHRELKAIIDDFVKQNHSSSLGSQQIQFVGGSFLGNILGSVTKHLTPIRQVVKGVHTVSGLADKGLEMLGAAKRGRPSGRY